MASYMYGGTDGSRTIHGNKELNVELDADGKVIAVWFRCMLLPFTQHVAEDFRVAMLHGAESNVELLGVEINVKDDTPLENIISQKIDPAA